MKKGTLKICANGHRFYKSSDCPVCPQCEKLRNNHDNWMQVLAVPARRALENAGIKTVKDLAAYTRKELLALHGLGPSAIPKLKSVLEKEGMDFKL